MELPEAGSVHTLLADSVNQAIEAFTSAIAGLESSVLIITRLAPRRLVRYIDLEGIEFRWLTTHEDEHAIEPSLEHLSHLLFQTTGDTSGIIWFDGLEYLAGRQGFNAAHSFVRSIVDTLVGSDWGMLVVLASGTFDDTQIAQISREASALDFVAEDIDVEDETPIEDSPDPEDLVDEQEGSSIPEQMAWEPEEMAQLTRISRAGFTRKTLRERIIRWRTMGLDVSLLEPAMQLSDEEQAYQLYLEIDARVRRAIELDARLPLLRDVGESARAHAFQYRIRQLTGLDEIERMLDGLLGNEETSA